MDFAEADFYDIVAEGRDVMLVIVIDSLIPQTDNDPETETGTLKVTIRKEITSGKWRGPEQFQVAYTRIKDPMKRDKLAIGWNQVEIEPGRFLLLAMPYVADDHPDESFYRRPLPALAVEALTSPEDDYVQAMDKALEIERAKDMILRKALLREALMGKSSVLSGYAHYALGRLERLPRNDAVELELNLLGDSAHSLDDRVAALINLELELWKSDDPDDRLNRRILEGAFAVLLSDDPELQEAVVGSLYGLLVSEAPEEDREADRYRSRLTKGMSLPPKDALLAVTRRLESDSDIAEEATWLSTFIRQR
ncbi:MAG: hypothetical protein PHR28_04485 [candidate division Zixibacteria bacterium]|nr:hypothetical protein [candidate division Zixibacteria bacterium]